MMSDRIIWHKLEELYAGAKTRAVIIAPFIKLPLFEAVVSAIPRSVEDVVCVTRWSATEVAAGVSDPEVLEAAENDGRVTVRLCHSLHAKIYIADDRALVGSANLTRKAVGKSTESNIEILVQEPADHPEVSEAAHSALSESVLATKDAALAVRMLANQMAGCGVGLMPVGALGAGLSMNWYPRTRRPKILFRVYRGDVKGIIGDSRQDALVDLAFLDIAPGLSEEIFSKAICNRLYAFREIAELLQSGSLTSDSLQRALQSSSLDDGVDPRIRADTFARWLLQFDPTLLQVPTGKYEIRRAIDLT